MTTQDEQRPAIEKSFESSAMLTEFARQHFEKAFECLVDALQAASAPSGRWTTWEGYILAYQEAEKISDHEDPTRKKLLRKYDRWAQFAHGGSTSSVERELMSAINVYLDEGWRLLIGSKEFADEGAIRDWRIHNGIATDEDYDDEEG